MKRYISIFCVVAAAFTLSLLAFRQDDEGYSSFKDRFLQLINQTRTRGCNCGGTWYPPAPPLVWNNQLEDAARGHAKYMARRNYFSHDSKDGRSMTTRIVQAGYQFKGWKSFMSGENIAFGQQTIEEVQAGWFKSEGHCKNLMNPGFKEVGVAEKDRFWVQDFGGRVPFSPEQQRLMKEGKLRLIQRD
ncbi:CAP domain-containing protein [Mucilaginibacter sp.]|uniref:CAP domain-containing protein n=1 Tax=Mucilaginibacter sp. TaxID=1882438 RepID=UPI000CBD28E9|nr:CAP domain-containing protein [Mucilaginibacter sp.]PLW88868.1 MAG: CAP domain-containing protein [Mucilaginibacter sp.]HEK22090.1 CAP domain-containing protein [Bacteroidota bacterium]